MNATFDDFKNLTDIQWRKSVESEWGLFIAEGSTTIDRALELGYVPRSALTTQRWLQTFPVELLDRVTPIVVSDEMMQEITGYHVHRGALVSFDRKPNPAYQELLSTAKTLVVLEDIVDHENVGAIMRSAAGMNVDCVLLSQSCADPLYRRSVKVSMGAALSIPHSRFDGPETFFKELAAYGFESWAMTPDGETELWSAVKMLQGPLSKVALWLGAEGDGLKQQTMDACDAKVSIPMSRGTDSLNVATSAAIAMWALTQRGNL